MITKTLMQYLPFDVKLTIASFRDYAWIAFYRYDYEFNKYARTEVGRQRFVALFTRCSSNAFYVSYTLFGKLHREGDLPAHISIETGTQYWYNNHQLHRDNDKPAVDGRFMHAYYKRGVMYLPTRV